MHEHQEIIDRKAINLLLIKSIFFGFIGLALLSLFFIYTQQNWHLLIDPSSGYLFQSALLNSALFLVGAVYFYELARWTFNLNKRSQNHIYAAITLIIIATLKAIHFLAIYFEI